MKTPDRPGALQENPCAPSYKRRIGSAALGLLLISSSSLALLAQDTSALSASELRQLIDRQVGGLSKLRVPARNADIPLPRNPDGSVNPRFQTTEAKRYLGKLLFHDPVRTARVNINTGQPLDLPAGTAFGGTVSENVLGLQQIVNATRQTGSCGSCHIGEAATKAGQLLNFNTGGEGRGYTDARGNFVPRRRPQSILTKLRTAPIFPGDALVDALPTLTDIYTINGQRQVTTPAPPYHMPAPTALLATGRLDQLDSVGRLSPSVIGFAFNNRLLFGGFGGEPASTTVSINPFGDPAGENMTLLLLDAHRMLNFQSAELLKIPAYMRLFREAFPEEAAVADARRDMNELVNDQTQFRAQATFLRTVVTRNTPYDRFLAGDNGALTEAQRRGARLFFSPAANGAGGAGCFTCHSGPMLNKQPNDPDVAGVGMFVEENFFNLGIGDHPVQALNALARNRLNPNRLGTDGFPYHAEDTGREEVTGRPEHRFAFRSLTMRQLKDARGFFHNGSFTSVRDVVEYFNAGIPQDETAGAAPTLSTRFTFPRGPNFPRGLGLTPRQVSDLTDFLENGLYDPAFVTFDPKSTTDVFQPSEVDLTYSKYRPDLAALGARDGFMPSGLPVDNADPLTRRDEGLEFLDVTGQLTRETISTTFQGGLQTDRVRITNRSQSVVDTHLLMVVRGLTSGTRLRNSSGTTRTGGNPYLRIFLPSGVLQPGDSIVRELNFRRPGGANVPVPYTLEFMSGQGNP
ncbi:MAG: hypothetical protein K2X03_22910 [Bryobacteraceae bacterium]|nr:hypothetical protein [Bryobacteraceae bacterium]